LRRGSVLLVALTLIVAGLRGAVAQTSEAAPNGMPLNEQVIRVPGEDPPAVTLQVTVLRPDGDGPFPLAIMNHGATEVSAGHRGERYRLTNAAFYFLSRGYAVALPMMRGFAASGGEIYHFGCDLGATGTADAEDIRAVIHYLGNDPLIDTRSVIVAGQSFGGWNTLALGAMNIPNVKGLINFNGGLIESDCKLGDSSLIAAAGAFGARTKVPSLWFYGENDALFSVRIWRAMYERYNSSGGHADLVDIGTFMQNSHNFLALPESQPLWVPKVDSFLLRIGMPSAPVNPRYMPAPFPPATSFAAIDDVAAVPYLNDKGRDFYRKFLAVPFPRAVVITEAGGISSFSGGFDPLGRALGICQNRSVRCGIYAVDDHVVWKPFSTEARERSLKMTLKQDQPTVIDFAYRLNPDCSPRSFAKFREIQSPKHGHVDTAAKDDFPKFPDGSPLAACNKNPVHGVALTFTPAKGYTGEDFFSVTEDAPVGPETTLMMSLTIK
jgi:dienelactone hydrolase